MPSTHAAAPASSTGKCTTLLVRHGACSTTGVGLAHTASGMHSCPQSARSGQRVQSASRSFGGPDKPLHAARNALNRTDTGACVSGQFTVRPVAIRVVSLLGPKRRQQQKQASSNQEE